MLHWEIMEFNEHLISMRFKAAKYLTRKDDILLSKVLGNIADLVDCIPTQWN